MFDFKYDTNELTVFDDTKMMVVNVKRKFLKWHVKDRNATDKTFFKKSSAYAYATKTIMDFIVEKEMTKLQNNTPKTA